MAEFDSNGAVFTLGLDASQFKKETSKAERRFAQFAASTNEKILDVRQEFSNYFINDLAANTIQNAFESSFEFLGGFAESSKELVNVADAFQLSIEGASELQAIAKGTETDLAALANAASQINPDALVGLGLDENALAGKGAGERLATVLDALQQVPDAAQRAAVGAAVFGDSFADVSALADSAKGSTLAFVQSAREAGLIATEDGARGAAKFSDALLALKDSATALANGLAQALLPAFQEGAGLLTELARATSKLIAPTAEASAEIATFGENADATRRAWEELRKLDASKFAFAADLAGQGRLTEETFSRAASVVEELQTKYGDLGFSVDAATRSIELATGAQERFNAAANAREIDALKEEAAELESFVGGLKAEKKEKLESLEGFGASVLSAPRNVASLVTGGAVRSSSDVAKEEVDALSASINQAEARQREIRERLRALESGEGGATTEVETAVDSAPVDAGGVPIGATPSPDSAPSAASALDRELAALEARFERAGKTDEQNAVDDARKEEADYRAKIEERLEIERSKGASNADAELIADLTAKLAASTAREEVAVAKIRDAFKEEPKGLDEGAILAESLDEYLQRKADAGGEPSLDDDRFAELLEDPDYFEDALAATKDAAKSSAATFSAFDAANLASAGLEEKALKEAERQTRILEEIRNAERAGAVFA